MRMRACFTDSLQADFWLASISLKTKITADLMAGFSVNGKGQRCKSNLTSLCFDLIIFKDFTAHIHDLF